ncbi:YbfB/YjiJ family MFS transporter [uncultured Enterovirga sp.]|uniref:YbfB/YjiJ family MFS transporter n=1 Tax=uncultured Enterovirga sp. TaxID=2026352 RepID=UPI0035CBC85B
MITAPAPASDRTLALAFAGATATLSGNGLARFAYVPLFPAMVTAGWVSGAEAGLLGALNLAGYLVGVLSARSLARRLGTPAALNLGMALVVLSLSACAWHAGVPWLAFWRGAAGIAGGILMALAGPAVQGAVPAARRGFAGGIVLSGVAGGVVASALVVPTFLEAGIPETWLGLALVAAVLWACAARAWPSGDIVIPTAPSAGAGRLYVAYALSAGAFVPHMVYFADLVVRGRSMGLDQAALAWLLFGLGGLPGPLLVGRMADRWGAGTALRIGIGIQIASLALVFVPGRLAVMSAAALGGFTAVGIAAAALARARELAGPAAGAIWVRATAGFAVAQALTGFALAALFSRTESHDALFAAGLALAVGALVPLLFPASQASA